MVLIEVKDHWWNPKLHKWDSLRNLKGRGSSSRHFKTLRAARRHLAYVLDKYPASTITFWYRSKNRSGYELVYPVSKTAQILYGKKQ